MTAPSPTSLSDATCFLGMTRMCTGMTGLMSGNAIAPSFSPTFFAGILPATILQKTQSSMVTSEQLPGVEQQRHRAFVDDAHPHGGPKDAFRQLNAALPDEAAEFRVERLGHLGARRFGESRPVPLAGVSEQRELRDREHGAAHVEDRAVHLALVVLEDAQVHDLAGEPARILLRVAFTDAQQDAEAQADGAFLDAVDRDGSLADPLHHRAHAAIHISPRRGGRGSRGPSFSFPSPPPGR